MAQARDVKELRYAVFDSKAVIFQGRLAYNEYHSGNSLVKGILRENAFLAAAVCSLGRSEGSTMNEGGDSNPDFPYLLNALAVGSVHSEEKGVFPYNH